MDRERLDNLIEKSILGLVISALCYGPIAFGAVNKRHFLVIQALVSLALLLWFTRIWINPKRRILFPPTCWAVLAFVIYAGVRYWQADVEYVARQEFLKIVTYASLFFVVLNNLYRQEQIRIIFSALIILGFCLSAYAVFQYLTESKNILSRPQPEQFYGRASGTYVCPNHLAGFLEMLVPICIAMALLAKMGPIKRIFFGYTALVMLAGIGVTISRGGYISIACGLALLFGILIFKRGYRIAIITAAAVIIGAGTWFIQNNLDIKQRFSEAITPSGPILVDMRTRMWEPTVTLWKEHFWFGVGPDHFNLRFPAVRPVNFQASPEYVHNDYLNTLVDYGTTGLALILIVLLISAFAIIWTWYRVVRAAASSSKSERGNSKTYFLLGGGVALLTLMVHSVVDFNMHIPANAAVLVVILSLISSHWRHATNTWWFSSRTGSRIALSVPLLSALLLLATEFYKGGNEQLRIFQAKSSDATVSEKFSLLEEAFAFDRKNCELAAYIGENYWRTGSRGGENYETQTESAIHWLTVASDLNPYDFASISLLGMSYDWIYLYDEGEPFFKAAEKLDPHGYYTMAVSGWHYYMKGDYQSAFRYFRESKRLSDTVHIENPLVEEYLPFVQKKIAEPG